MSPYINSGRDRDQNSVYVACPGIFEDMITIPHVNVPITYMMINDDIRAKYAGYIDFHRGHVGGGGLLALWTKPRIM